MVVGVVCTKVGSACSASLPDPATLTQPDAVPSQQYGSSVAFTASSRIEAFSLWQVWAVGWCLVAPHPQPRLSLAEDFTGPPTPHQSWPSCTVLWGGAVEPHTTQQAPVEGSPQDRGCLVPRLNFQPVDDTRDILEVHPHILCRSIRTVPARPFVSGKGRKPRCSLVLAPSRKRNVSLRDVHDAGDQHQNPNCQGRSRWLTSTASLSQLSDCAHRSASIQGSIPSQHWVSGVPESLVDQSSGLRYSMPDLEVKLWPHTPSSRHCVHFGIHPTVLDPEC